MGGHRSRVPPVRSVGLDITKPYGYVTYMSVEAGSRPRARSAGRPRDPQIGHAIDSAVRRLLSERSFAGMTMDAVAAEAGVGKPAIYRRYRDKAQMVASVVAEQLPVMDPPDLGDTKAENMLAMFTHGLPAEGLSYVALIGGLIAEKRGQPSGADRGLPGARAAAAAGHGAERDRTRSGAPATSARTSTRWRWPSTCSPGSSLAGMFASLDVELNHPRRIDARVRVHASKQPVKTKGASPVG